MGCKHGQGKMVFADGSFYEGMFKMNDIEGLGVFQWPDGKIYEGAWL